MTVRSSTRKWILSAVIALGVFVVMELIGIVSPVFAAESEGVDSNEMPTGQKVFITLAENQSYRWNANDSALKNSVVHLDTCGGYNCRWRLDKIDNTWYGIKHIKDAGIDYFADMDDKSNKPGTVVHLWEDEDKKVAGNNHRQFAFSYRGKDKYGNKQYYIYPRNASGKHYYLGYEGNLSGTSKVNLSDSNVNHRKLWIVTKCVVPFNGNEVKVTDKYTGSTFEIYRKGALDTLNRAGDASSVDTSIHFYNTGTSSKWRFVYVPEYDAYRIDPVNRQENTFDMSLNTYGEYGDNDIGVVLNGTRSNNNNEHTSQLWRFIKRDDNGTYWIQNAMSGLYMSTDKNGYISLTGKGDDMTLSCVDGEPKDKNDSGVVYKNGTDWMSKIPDDAKLSSVNIPGSHDTGTAICTQEYFASCQNLFMDEQLNVGVRSFDIRTNSSGDNNTVNDVKINHGSMECNNRKNSNLTLGEILSDSKNFLAKHPTETIMLTIKPDEGGGNRGTENAMAKYIRENPNLFYSGGDIPSMREARGKIVLMRRYTLRNEYKTDQDKVVKAAMGFDLIHWDSIDYSNYRYAKQLYKDDDGNNVYVQDHYSTASDGKWPYIQSTMQQTVNGDKAEHPIAQNSYVYNYTSCAGAPWSPVQLTRDINPKLYYDHANLIDHRFLGMMMLNFASDPMASLIYETNNGLVFEPKVKAPTVTVTRGSTLGKAEVKYASEKPVGVWTFDQPDMVVKASQKYAATFTPEDTKTYKKVKMDIDVTVVDAENVANQTNETQETPKEDQNETNQTVAANTALEKTIEAAQNTPSVTFPTSATLTYGQRLSEATFTGQSGDGTFSFDDGDKILNAGTSKQMMTFVPYGTDANNIVKKEVEVTVNKADVTVMPVRQEKIYGRRLLNNKLKYAVNGLVNGDDESKLNLNVKLKADGLKARDKVDAYTIGYDTKRWKNDNYNVNFEDGILIVQPYTLKANWPNVGEYLFTGRRIRLMPQLDKVLFDDDCTFEVEGNVQQKLGTYQAAITALKGKDRFNYVLADDSDKTFKIVKTLSPGENGQAPNGQTTANTKVKTGDDTSVLIYLAAFAAACGVAAYLFRRKRENKA